MKTQLNIQDLDNPLHGVPSSGDVAGIELRMLPPYIRNNHTLHVRPFFPGRARLYCLTLVVSDAANQLYGLMDLNAFLSICSNEHLPINKTIFYWEAGNGSKAPNQVHVMCSVIKSKESLREAGQVMEQAKRDEDYKSLVSQLAMLGTEVSLPAISNMTLQIASVVGRYLGRVDDRPLGTIVQSFTRLHGDWDKLGITAIKTCAQDVDFEFELVIRDHEREIHPTETSGRITIIPESEKPEIIPAMIPL